MAEKMQRGLNVNFMDGSAIKISFPEQAENPFGRKVMMEEIVKRRMLAVEAEGGVLFIPFDNIKYVTVFPAPEYPDPSLIKGAKIEL
jgi:hypothetical protein